MKKSKIIWKVIRSVLLFAVFFLLLILIKSADWFINSFDEVTLASALYQITSPLQGTEQGMFDAYLYECLYPSLSFTVTVVIFYTIWDMIAEKLVLETDIQIISKTFCLKIGKGRFSKIGKIIVLWAAIIILGIGVWDRAVAVKFPEYVRSITQKSQLYADEYVSPDTVAVTFPEKKRNLIILYMESMEATYSSTEEGGGKPNNYIPELTELAKENLYFSDDEDLGGARQLPGADWTMGALLASSAGVTYKLPIDANDAGEYVNFLPGVKTIGEILEENGYRNYFMCGSDATFGGRRLFYEEHGDYEIYDFDLAKAEGLIPIDHFVFWGMEDEHLYEYAKRKLTNIAQQDEPFNFTMLTVDTHYPNGNKCELCGDEYPTGYENVLACASRQAQQFIDWIREQEWYEDTTIVITGDHLNMKVNFWDDIGDYERTVYNCFLNLPEELSAVRTTNRQFTVLDLFPTMLTAVGAEVEGDRLGLGTNLFSDRETLPEEMGLENFTTEIELYSDYYYMNFVVDSN